MLAGLGRPPHQGCSSRGAIANDETAKATNASYHSRLASPLSQIEGATEMYTILLVILVLLLLGALPTWPYSRSWGYYPSGGLLVVVIIIVLLLLRS